MLSEDAFNALAASLEAQKAAMIAELNRDLFTAAPSRPVPVRTTRQRWASRWAGVARYLQTLWAALCGRDPYEDEYA